MRTRTVLVPFAVAAGLATAGPASAASGPHAQLKGGDAPPIIPSIIQTRLTRTEKAIDRLTRYVDNQDSVKVTKVSKVIRRQTTAAWRGARYLLRTMPPPPPDDKALRRRSLHGDAVLPVIADPVTASISVFDLVHTVTATGIELTDGAHGNTLSALSRTMFWTLDKRDAMVTDANALQPPPVEDKAVKGRRLKQDDVVVGDYATLMPGVTQELDDEQQHIAGLSADATDLRPRGKTILQRATTQIAATEARINTLWPPAPPED
jgi:hypothetical protein